jgi:hypothetical protein
VLCCRRRPRPQTRPFTLNPSLLSGEGGNLQAPLPSARRARAARPCRHRTVLERLHRALGQQLLQSRARAPQKPRDDIPQVSAVTDAVERAWRWHSAVLPVAAPAATDARGFRATHTASAGAEGTGSSPPPPCPPRPPCPPPTPAPAPPPGGQGGCGAAGRRLRHRTHPPRRCAGRRPGPAPAAEACGQGAAALLAGGSAVQL